MTTGTEAGRRLVLLRHAKSAWPDMPDHERPLARRGQRDAPVMGRWLRAADLVPDLVLCSSARRARETWQLAQSGLGAAPPVRFDDRVYEASAAALVDLIRRESGAAETLLVVGHDPAIPELAVITSHDRWFLDRVATHILAWEGETNWSWFEGNFAAYEQDKAGRIGEEATRPHRTAYRKLTR
jgi:phosphohistidine phosphatase